MLLAEDHLWKWWSSTNSIGECISFPLLLYFSENLQGSIIISCFDCANLAWCTFRNRISKNRAEKKKLISTESFDSKVVFARWFALFTEGTHQVFSSWGFTRKLASVFCGTRHKTLSYLWAFFEASSLFPDQSANHSLDATRDSDTNVFPGWW